MGKELMPQNNARYNELVSIIERARASAFYAVNRELISMYWDIGQYISGRSKMVVGGNLSSLSFQSLFKSNVQILKDFQHKVFGG